MIHRLHWTRCVRAGIFGLLVCAQATFVVCGEGPQAGLPVLGKVRPKNSVEISNSPWGIQAGILDDSLVSRAAAIGVKWTRLQATWADIERKPGEYNWEKTDKAFSTALAHRITPFVTINGTNSLYAATRTDLDPKVAELYGTIPRPPTASPESMTMWLRFVERLVERYRSTIKYWEIWNEPNHFAFWGEEPDGKAYGRLVHEGANLIKRLDPEAKVLAGALAGLDPSFTDAFLGAGNHQLVDIVTFHNYGVIPEDRIYLADKVREVMRRHNPAIQLWQGECGTASHSSTSGYRGVSPWGERIQAKWLLRQSFTDTYFCGATMSNYFLLMDRRKRGQTQTRQFLSPLDSILGAPERGGTRVRQVGVNEKCLLENPGLKPKPGFFAYQNLCAIMDDRYTPVKVKHSITVNDVGIFYGIGPEDDAFPSVPLVASYRSAQGKTLVAYWLPWHPQELIRTAAIDLTLDGVAFQDPVLIDPLDGTVFALPRPQAGSGSIVLKDLPMGDYPFIIVERNEVEVTKH